MTDSGRFNAIDAARALGLILVYYGHFVEQIMYLNNAVAAAHYKWIYSFHMVLFFVLSGWVGARRTRSTTPVVFVKMTVASRILPYLFFSMIVGLVSLFASGWFPIVDLSSPGGYVQGLGSTLLGFPLFNIPMWFVACLVSVECLHRLVGGFLDTPKRVILVALLCYGTGYALNHEIFFFGLKRNIWFLHEVPVVYAFYLSGVLLGQSRVMESLSSGRAMLYAVLGVLFVQFTYDLNQGPFRYVQAVAIVLSGHGHFLWFPLTALFGTVMIMALGHLVQGWNWLAWLGRNALILLGMNGVFYHFVNAPLAAWYATTFPATAWAVFGSGIVVTTFSLGMCVPIIVALNTFVPQLVGKPRQGSVLFGPIMHS